MVRHSVVFHHLFFTWLTSFSLSFSTEFTSHVTISPKSPVVEIGTHFTATCMLVNTSEVTADELSWYTGTQNNTVPEQQYTKINQTAVNVTIAITTETPSWLYCKCKNSPTSEAAQYMYGIFIQKGYPPAKPENLSCISVQVNQQMSPNITCVWHQQQRGDKEMKTVHRLFFDMTSEKKEVQVDGNSGHIDLVTFPHHSLVTVWVEAENKLGKVQSDKLIVEANSFVKTNPPSEVKVLFETRFPYSLLIYWTQPIAKEYMRLKYQIRYCPHGSHTWTGVPIADTAKEIQSYRLQYLTTDTHYVAQVRCKLNTVGGYWSDWSINATAKTPEDKPMSKPDLWRTISHKHQNKHEVHIYCKDPLLSNGKITSFDIRIQGERWEKVLVNRSAHSSAHKKPVDLKQLEFSNWRSMKFFKSLCLYVEVFAHNSVGKSPQASLIIPKTAHDFPPVKELRWESHRGQLRVEWRAPNTLASHYNLSEYIVEWVSLNDGQMDWQREIANTYRTVVRGDLQKWTCYNISVYPLYSAGVGQSVTIGQSLTKAAYLEEGVPLEGPSVMTTDKIGSNEAELVWKEVPQDKRHGFIVNYTIVYSSAGGPEHVIPVPVETSSYQLKGLKSSTTYVVLIRAWTIKGPANGTEHSFTTRKYASQQIKGIVVGVSLGFLFCVVLIMLLCIYKKDSIKKRLWPSIPNPGNSRIGSWSPDFHSKDDAPQENQIADVSDVEVDVFDAKSVFVEDKSCLPLKKDKYLSEEHSSGIGDSSCMSSPRQSVSDSDEGAELGETTASTVQYSSVVASQGYKGQNPSALLHSQQPAFSRSESTQPLLDSEDNTDLSPKPSYRSATFNQHSCAELGEQDSSVLLHFWPLEQSPELQEAVSGSHVGSYRPQ